MDHLSYAKSVVSAVRSQPADVPTVTLVETRKNNAARCMTELICNRLGSQGQAPQRIKYTTFRWMDGVFALRNARITDHHWSTLQLNVAEQLHEDAQRSPLAYVLTYWSLAEKKLHVWAIPESIAYHAFGEVPVGRSGTSKTIEVFPETQTLKNAPNAPDLSPYYVQAPLLDQEATNLEAAIKMDHAVNRNYSPTRC